MYLCYLKDDDTIKSKRRRPSHFTEDDEKVAPTGEDVGQLSSAQIKNMMEAARQQIVMRRAQSYSLVGSFTFVLFFLCVCLSLLVQSSEGFH